MKSRKLAPNIPMPDYPARARPQEATPAANSEADSKGDIRQYHHIRVDLIDQNPLAPREIYTAQMILERAEALRLQGQHDPIHVIPNPDSPGRYIICDGWTRVLSCREHQVLTELLAEIHDLSLEEAAWYGYQQNEERQQHCDLDRAMFYEKLVSAGTSPAEIARRAGISKSQMTFYRAFSKLPSDVIEIVRASPERFGASAAYQLSKVNDKASTRQAVRLAARFVEEAHSYAWLVNQTQLLLTPEKHKNTAPSKAVRFSNGYYKQRGDHFEVNIAVSPDKRTAFAQALEQLLATVTEEAAAMTETDHAPGQ